jgi:hypothetical protein
MEGIGVRTPVILLIRVKFQAIRLLDKKIKLKFESVKVDVKSCFTRLFNIENKSQKKVTPYLAIPNKSELVKHKSINY